MTVSFFFFSFSLILFLERTTQEEKVECSQKKQRKEEKMNYFETAAGQDAMESVARSLHIIAKRLDDSPCRMS